MADVDPD